MPIRRRIPHLTFAAAVVMLAASGLNAQASGDDALIDQLNEIVANRPDLTPDNFEQIARLIPTPDGQVKWLIEQVEAHELALKPDFARTLLEKAELRADIWRTRGVELNDGVIAEMGKASERLTPIEEITDPEKLKTRWSRMSVEQRQALSNQAKFILFARGIDLPSISLVDDYESIATTVCGDLAGKVLGEKVDLPKPSALLIKSNAANAMASEPLGGHEPFVKIAHEIAVALLERSLGLDGEDRGLSEQDKPDYWTKAALELEQLDLWRWATLARLLQAATTDGDEARRKVIDEAAMPVWQKLRTVNSETWPAVDLWLKQISANLSDSDGGLPLRAGFRLEGRQQRAFYTAEFLKAKDNSDLDQAFKSMQLAKWADLSLKPGQLADAKPVSIDELRAFFGLNGRKENPRFVNVYLEILEYRPPDSNAAPTYYGFVLRDKTGDLGSIGDEYVTEMIEANSPEVIAGKALAWMSDIDVKNNRKYVGGAFVVAPDGACRGSAWLGKAEQQFLGRVDPSQNSWLLYVPTAAALEKGSPWQVDATVRAWHLSIYPEPLRVIEIGGPRGSRITRSVSPVRKSDTLLTAFQLGSDYPFMLKDQPRIGWSQYAQHIASLKQAESANTLVLLVSQ